MINKALGVLLQSLRKTYGYSQKSLADYLHVAQNTYSSYERGVIQPTLTTIMHLATLYSLSEEIFFHPDKWNHLEMLPQTNPNLHTPMDRTCLTTKEQLLIATIRQIDLEKIQICCIEKLIEWIQLFTCQ